MAESKVGRDNYVALQGWMLTDLGLKGNELIIYACIYGFSQAESQVFSGSLQYLADWTNSTKQGVLRCLKSLVEKGYIVKKDKVINGVKFCEYHATKFNGVLNKVEWGIQQSLPNNLEDNIENNLGKKVSKASKKPVESFDSIIAGYTEDQSLRETLAEFIKMRQRIRKPMTNYALNLMLKKLDKLGSTTKAKADVLNQSIVNSWQDVYPIKSGKWTGQKQADGYAGFHRPTESKEPSSTFNFDFE